MTVTTITKACFNATIVLIASTPVAQANVAYPEEVMDRESIVSPKYFGLAVTGPSQSIMLKPVAEGALGFKPKTKLGHALWEARKRIVASRSGLQSARELMEELAASRR